MRFDAPVAPGGYRWWYLDGLSDDGAYGITLIAFVGSVFSPYYAWRRWREPWDHCAVNVCLYRLDGRGGRWAMTERGRGAVHAEASRFVVGRSGLAWDGEVLRVRVDEMSAPLPRRVRGTITLTPRITNERVFTLDPAGRHRWQPLAPLAHVEVAMEQPSLSWRGTGYWDSNEGDEPLEHGFSRWHWGRSSSVDSALLHYDPVPRAGVGKALALRFSEAGLEHLALPPRQTLPSAKVWRIRRAIPALRSPSIQRTLEDTPFYARSLLVHDEGRTMMQESLDLDRFASTWVKVLLPFRMPRALVRLTPAAQLPELVKLP